LKNSKVNEDDSDNDGKKAKKSKKGKKKGSKKVKKSKSPTRKNTKSSLLTFSLLKQTTSHPDSNIGSPNNSSDDDDNDATDPWACEDHKQKLVSKHCMTFCIKRSIFYLELT
tara:strand:+ start:554 stop:889 length:336 start_codon:yes stop_codon:yes gene_type:complete